MKIVEILFRMIEGCGIPLGRDEEQHGGRHQERRSPPPTAVRDLFIIQSSMIVDILVLSMPSWDNELE